MERCSLISGPFIAIRRQGTTGRTTNAESSRHLNHALIVRTVVSRNDELLAQSGIESGGAFINSMLSDVLLDDRKPLKP